MYALADYPAAMAATDLMPEASGPTPSQRDPLWPRLVLALFVIAAFAAVGFTNYWLSDRFTETTRNRAEVRLALYSGNVISELQRTAVVPLLLARDPELITALEFRAYTLTTQRLILARDEIGAASIVLLDDAGHAVAATDRTMLGGNHANAAYFYDAQRGGDTMFTVASNEGGGYEFYYSRAIRAGGRIIGVIVVGVDLSKLERNWAGTTDAVLVTDSAGAIILSTEPRWRGLTVADALAARSAPSAIARAFRATADWANKSPDAYVQGEAVMRNEARIPFRGWRLVSFTSYDSIRDRVNAAILLELLGLASFAAVGFYLLSRRARGRTKHLELESAELRALNLRLQREIAEREKMQKSLAVAEQTIAQSSKLAVLGEMSASVSHELNQPLAAMKTYLAGARLLLRRKRPDEAMSSFQRIDDLIERMGAITRQLKSYARKGGEAFEPVEVRESISAALAMMEPQLRARTVRINRTLPRERVTVMADRIRLEQVIINLLRNAIDATKDAADPCIDILLTRGANAVITVRDNGHGIEDLENLFEPFYTTKKAGDGVGLGLAISSGIVTDFGGRLTARNAAAGGAVFEVSLPLIPAAVRAAE